VYQGDYGWPILCGVRNNPEKFPPAYNFLEVMMETEKKAWRTYRQSLVDVLEQEGCPFKRDYHYLDVELFRHDVPFKLGGEGQERIKTV
jgi:hypothetical protein